MNEPAGEPEDPCPEKTNGESARPEGAAGWLDRLFRRLVPPAKLRALTAEEQVREFTRASPAVDPKTLDSWKE